MYDLNQGLKDEVLKINTMLLKKYNNILTADKESLRAYLNSNIGNIKKINSLNEKKIKRN